MALSINELLIENAHLRQDVQRLGEENERMCVELKWLRAENERMAVELTRLRDIPEYGQSASEMRQMLDLLLPENRELKRTAALYETATKANFAEWQAAAAEIARLREENQQLRQRSVADATLPFQFPLGRSIQPIGMARNEPR